MVTVNDLLREAQELAIAAAKIENELEHGAWWDNKVDLLASIQQELQKDIYTGGALEDLKQAQHLLWKAEQQAGKYLKGRV